MTNFEYATKYYPNLLISLVTDSSQKLAIDISSDDGYRMCKCSDINCGDCLFNRPDKTCEELSEEWFRDEYNGTIDTPDTSSNNEGGISW